MKWLAAALLAPALAAAQDAFVDVPVRVKSVDATARVGSVTCSVFADPGGHSNNAGYLGSGSQRFELKGGVYAGAVSVPVKFDAGTMGTPKSFKCALYFILRQGEHTRTLSAARIADPLAPEYRDAFRRAAGAPFVPEVKGQF